MSWDIFVQDLPPSAKTLEDIPDDFEPKKIFNRADLIRRIKAIVPNADFSRPAWGVVESSTVCLEFNLGESEEMTGFAIHARGFKDDAVTIAKVLDHLQVRALDSQTGDFFSLEKCDVEAWRTYRDQITGRNNV